MATTRLADIATLVSPQQLTLILAAAVPPTLQLVVPADMVSPLAAPPPPPETTAMPAGKQEVIKHCKSLILPDPQATCLRKCEKRTPTRVLTAAIFYYLEKHLFDDATPRSEIANAFAITTAQLHKAITRVDYKSGPHNYKQKRQADDVEPSTPAKHHKTDAEPAPSTSGSNKQVAETLSTNTLTSSSSSEELPDVPFS